MEIRNHKDALQNRKLTRRQALKLATAAGALTLGRPFFVSSVPLTGSPRPVGSINTVVKVGGSSILSTLPQTVLYYGTEEPLPEAIDLRAGPLSMIFEPKNAFLRYIRFGDREIVRGIYVAVRDRNWGTVAPKISNLKTEITAGAFRLSFDVDCEEGDINFHWNGDITGDSSGSVVFGFNGTARSTFWRNRLGFAVLHPIRECAGNRCVMEKGDGTLEQGVFPRYISPTQPFKDMRAISHEVVPRLMAEIRFEGEIFEMEDQRNWTDASYKTYCTPLSLPYPVEVKEGTKIGQSIKLNLKGKASAELPKIELASSNVTITVDQKSPTPLPLIGLGMASHGHSLTNKELQRLKQLNLSHLRVDLKLSEPHYQGILSRAASEAKALGVSLEVALFLGDSAEAELTNLARELEQLKPGVSTWLIFQTKEKSTTEPAIRLARRHLSRYDPKAKIGAGTNAYFAELNRGRPPVPALDLVSYSMNPQIHAYDNATLVETLEAQAGTIESARQFSGHLPLSASPVTLRPRFNPNATGPEPEPRPGELPPQVDVRQMSLFGAGWTLGSIKHLAASGTYSVTYYETTGWRGVMEAEDGPSLPKKFHSIAGAVFPLYHVLADVGEFAGGHSVSTTSSAPLNVEAMALKKGDRFRVLLANLGPKLQYVRVRNSKLGGYVRVKRLDEFSGEESMRFPESFRDNPGLLQQISNPIEIALLPYAIVRLDPAKGP